MDLTTRVNLVKNHSKNKESNLPVSVVAKLASVNRTSIYYKGTPISDEELECKRIIDRLHTDNPTWGARQMSSQLKQRGYKVGRRKARRYMDEMGINPVYPKPNLSKRLKQAQVVPYLLRNAVIDRPNQAWSIDITYIPMKHGFLYLTAIIDWHSRCIVGWELDDTLDTRACIEACEKAFKVAKPEILNSDQGCQFTSQKYKDFLKANKIKQSMDGKSRWADNIMNAGSVHSSTKKHILPNGKISKRHARLSLLIFISTTLSVAILQSVMFLQHPYTIQLCYMKPLRKLPNWRLSLGRFYLPITMDISSL